MNVQPVRSDAAYRAMMAAPAGKRGDLYRYELMAPFKEKWDCYRVPLKAAEPGGYDVVMASEMLGILPPAASGNKGVRLQSPRVLHPCVAETAPKMQCTRVMHPSCAPYRGLRKSRPGLLRTASLASVQESPINASAKGA